MTIPPLGERHRESGPEYEEKEQQDKPTLGYEVPERGPGFYEAEHLLELCNLSIHIGCRGEIDDQSENGQGDSEDRDRHR